MRAGLQGCISSQNTNWALLPSCSRACLLGWPLTLLLPVQCDPRAEVQQVLFVYHLSSLSIHFSAGAFSVPFIRKLRGGTTNHKHDVHVWSCAQLSGFPVQHKMCKMWVRSAGAPRKRIECTVCICQNAHKYLKGSAFPNVWSHFLISTMHPYLPRCVIARPQQPFRIASAIRLGRKINQKQNCFCSGIHACHIQL